VIITEASVREYMLLDSTPSNSRYSNGTIGSNIRAATWTLERATGRVFGDTTATLKFTTNGAAFLALPGLRSASAVTKTGVASTADSDHYLIPDSQQTGVYTGIQFRAFGTASSGYGWWKHNPNWFDQNLDHPHHPANRGYNPTSEPNDLVITGSWGWTDALMPEAVRHAVKVLAAFYTKRPDAILSGGITTPDGNTFDLSRYPVEVAQFIADWRVSSMWQVAA
jgi:hypothetical protein